MTDHDTAQLSLTDYGSRSGVQQVINRLVADRSLVYRPAEQPDVTIRCSPCEGHPFTKTIDADGLTVEHPLTRVQVATRVREETFTLSEGGST